MQKIPLSTRGRLNALCLLTARGFYGLQELWWAFLMFNLAWAVKGWADSSATSLQRAHAWPVNAHVAEGQKITTVFVSYQSVFSSCVTNLTIRLFYQFLECRSYHTTITFRQTLVQGLVWKHRHPPPPLGSKVWRLQSQPTCRVGSHFHKEIQVVALVFFFFKLSARLPTSTFR